MTDIDASELARELNVTVADILRNQLNRDNKEN